MRIDSNFCPVISTWLNGSQIIRVGVEMNGSAGLKCEVP